MATQGKEAHKQLSITLIKPILHNWDKHHIENDMEQKDTIDPKLLQNELAEYESAPEVED